MPPERRIPPRDQWIEQLAWLMDQSIPLGRRWSIGLDGLLGLLPGFGDVAGAFVSSMIIASAVRAGLPRAAILHMIGNVALDSMLGSVPLVGDLFDFAYKSNTKNVEIYKRSSQTRRSQASDWIFILLVFLVLMSIALVPLLIAVYLIGWLQ